jgi:cation:H+ antiporter
MLASSLNLLIGLALLYAGGDALVRGAATLGTRLGMSSLLTGLTIVAFGTSAPELMVSLQAALQDEGGLAVGNVVGSNICNIGLILGMSILIRPIGINAALVRRDVPIMIVCALMLFAFLNDDEISRLEGALLLTGLAAHIVFTIRESNKARKRVRREFREAMPAKIPSFMLSVVMVVLGLGILVLGGNLFVKGGISLASYLGVPPAIVGLSVMAIGTSLPEFATSIVAAIRGYGDMVAGNVVGSNIFNVLSVIGLTASSTSVTRGSVTNVDLAVMMVASLLALRLMRTDARMDRWEGSVLLVGYLLYIGSLFA